VFACFGSVSLTDPVAELVRLGLLPSPEHRSATKG
jgi:hypothetical protein